MIDVEDAAGDNLAMRFAAVALVAAMACEVPAIHPSPVPPMSHRNASNVLGFMEAPGRGSSSFVLRDRNVSVFAAPSKLVFSIVRSIGAKGGWGLTWRPLDAEIVEPRRGAARSQIVYPNLWPGIDLVVEPRAHALAYGFEVARGADERRIHLAWEGISRLEPATDRRGMILHTEAAVLRESGLRCYAGASAREVPCRFEVDGATYRVVVEGRSAGEPLRIDPEIEWSSFLGGAAEERGYSIALGPSSSIYVAGTTYSSDFPTELGFDSSLGGSTDAYVVRFAASGEVEWATFLGGSGDDEAGGIAVDLDGDAFVAGVTASANFPSSGGFDASLGGSFDAYVVRIEADGSGLVWATYVGGSAGDRGSSLAYGGDGAVVIAGLSNSDDFPTSGAGDSSYGDFGDAFAMKLDSTDSTPLWGAYFGGSSLDWANAITVDGDGHAYMTGYTNSADLPTTEGMDDTLGGDSDVFVAKVGLDGGLTWASYLGGGGVDRGWGIAVANDDLIVAGETESDDFLVINALDDSFGGGLTDGFVTRLSLDGIAIWSSFLGGSGDETVYGAAWGAGPSVYVAGLTTSADFPTQDGFDTSFGGGLSDAFVTKIDGSGAVMGWSSFVGGSGQDMARGIAVDSEEALHLVGATESSDFPAVGAFDDSFGGVFDAFVVRIARLPNGQSCTGHAACLSGICEDGICCSEACGLCSSCDDSGTTCSEVPADDAACGACAVCEDVGACSALTAGTDPDDECPEGPCLTGTCDALGGCGVVEAGEPCGFCLSCDGAGECVPTLAGEDAADVCPAGTCLTGACDGSGACGVVDMGVGCGFCAACDGAGSCVLAAEGADPGDDCPDGPCLTGACDGAGECASHSPGVDCGTCGVCAAGAECAAGLDQHEDCGLCQRCDDLEVCVSQAAGSDLKDECPSGPCQTGGCDGKNGCQLLPEGTSCGNCGVCDQGGKCVDECTPERDGGTAGEDGEPSRDVGSLYYGCGCKIGSAIGNAAHLRWLGFSLCVALLGLGRFRRRKARDMESDSPCRTK